MFSSTPWTTTVLAVALAAIAAACFAYGAVLQQHAVAYALSPKDGTGGASQTRLGVESFRSLLRHPRWLVGWTLIAAGGLLHVSALLLAPISVVQPIGILAVPVAVLLAARSGRTRPGRAVLFGVALAAAGTGGFVLLAGSTAAAGARPVTWAGLVTALLAVTVVAVVLGLAARRRSAVSRCLGYAGIGAAGFGLGSALIRLSGHAIVADGEALWSPMVITSGFAAATALIAGAWAVQQAYGSGPAAVVVGALTVGDPLVAILLSVGLLGEGLKLGSVEVWAMVGCAATAAVGIRLLATHHPAALPNQASEPTRTLTAVG